MLLSSAVLVDLTPPVTGTLVDGNDPSYVDLEFTSNRVTVSLEWKDFHDPESTIYNYKVRVYKAE